MQHHVRFCWKWFLVALLLVGGPLARAQAPAWQSALAIGNDAQVTGIATAANGDVYLAGYFNSTASFGNIVLTNLGGADTFVAKWSTAQNAFVWAQQAGGSTTSGAFTTALAASGTSLYLAGQADGTPSFGSFSVPAASAGSKTLYVVKLTDAGTSASFAWLQSASSSFGSEVKALAVSGTSIYATGYFDTAASFGSTTLLTTNNGSPPPGGGVSSPLVDTFLAKLADAGSSAAWVGALRVGGMQNERPVALVASGPYVYLAGNSTSFPFTFDGSPPGAADGGALFVAKLTDASPMGAFTWVQRINGTGRNITTNTQVGLDELTTLAVAGSSLYVTGAFRNPQIDVGGVVLNNNSTVPNANDLFLAKLTDLGAACSFNWVQGLGSSPGGKISRALTIRGSDVYLAGTFNGTAAFGTTSLVSAGYEDIFVAKFTDTGLAAPVAWAQQAGGPGNDFPLALALVGPRLHVAGTYQFPSASFGGISLALTPPFMANGGYWATLPETSALATTPANAVGEAGIFPNPASTRATLRLPPTAAARTVQVLDMLGRPWRSQLVPPHTATATLDLAGLAPGLYVVRCGNVATQLVIR